MSHIIHDLLKFPKINDSIHTQNNCVIYIYLSTKINLQYY
jgi:hypothetical protein